MAKEKAKIKNKEVKGSFAFMEPEAIDKIIREKLELVRPRSRKKGDGCKLCKWTPYEIELRREVIIDYLRQGLSHRRIREEIMNRWGVEPSTVTRYINDAIESLTENRDAYIEHNREIMIERIEGLLEECIADGDRKNASKYTDQLNKIGGLYIENKNVDLSGDISFEFGA